MILLTGGTGFLGSHITKGLIENGYSLRIMVRKGGASNFIRYIDSLKNKGYKIEICEGDVLDVGSLMQAIEGVDAVVHAAAIVSFLKKDAYRMKKENESGAANIVNVCLELGTPKLIHISSVSSFGRNEKTQIIDENTKWVDSSLNTNYSISKKLAEKQVFRGIEEGLHSTILNPSLIIGESLIDPTWSTGTPKVIKQYADGYPFYPTGTNGLIAASDVAKAVALAIQTPEMEGKRWILSAETMSYKDFFTLISRTAGRKKDLIRLNPNLVKWVGGLNELIAPIFGVTPLISSETAKTSVLGMSYNGSLFTKTFEFSYQNIRSVIEDTTNLYLHSVKKNKLMLSKYQ